jgi:hypothetical protein
MANVIGQRSSIIGFFDGLTDYLYVYARADGRIVTRCHPNASPSTLGLPSLLEPRPEWSHHESDITGLEEQESEHKQEEQTKESKSVILFLK